MLGKLLGRQHKNFSERTNGPLELSTARERIHELEKELSRLQSELSASEAKNKELKEKLAQLKTEQRNSTKRHTLRFEILRDMLGLELLRNTDAATLGGLVDKMNSMPDKSDADAKHADSSA